jgi:hypothetical protein
MPINIDTRRDIGIVNIKNEGNSRRNSLRMSKKLTPLLTIKSISWRSFPMMRTKVRTKRIIKNG